MQWNGQLVRNKKMQRPTGPPAKTAHWAASPPHMLHSAGRTGTDLMVRWSAHGASRIVILAMGVAPAITDPKAAIVASPVHRAALGMAVLAAPHAIALTRAPRLPRPRRGGALPTGLKVLGTALWAAGLHLVLEFQVRTLGGLARCEGPR